MTGAPAKVKITYCAECGYEPQTLELARALMLEFGSRLAGIELIPWDSGTFDVSLDGQILHSMRREGGFPDNEKIKKAVRAHLTV
jgi:selenoprotein W-related protein